VDTPYIRIEDTGELIPLRGEVTTVGRGHGVDIRLDDPSVSRLHAEIVRRGPYIYLADLGLSRNGTRVNGRPVARRVLDDGDVLSFGSARCRIEGVPREELAAEAELRRSAAPELTRRELDVLSFGSARCRIEGVPREELAAEAELRRSAAPELTRRELDVLISLCRPALSDDAFVTPATAREIAGDLVVTEAAVKQHLLRLYQKFRVPEGPNRRTRLANEVIALGLVRPLAEHGSRQVQHAHGVPEQPLLDGVQRSPQ
jgi:FHA domain